MGATEAYHYAKIGKYGIDFVLATQVLYFSQIYCFYVYILPTETFCNLINCLLWLCYRLLDAHYSIDQVTRMKCSTGVAKTKSMPYLPILA